MNILNGLRCREELALQNEIGYPIFASPCLLCDEIEYMQVYTTSPLSKDPYSQRTFSYLDSFAEL